MDFSALKMGYKTNYSQKFLSLLQTKMCPIIKTEQSVFKSSVGNTDTLDFSILFLHLVTKGRVLDQKLPISAI